MNWYDEFGEQVRLNVPLAPLTWFGLGGSAKYYVQPARFGAVAGDRGAPARK